MLHIDLDSLELRRMDSYLREAKLERRQSASDMAPKQLDSHTDCSRRGTASEKSLPGQLEDLLSKLDLDGASDDEDEELEIIPKNGESANTRESYEKLRKRNEQKARELNFRFEDSGFDGGLFLDGVTQDRLDEGIRHLNRLKRFLKVVYSVDSEIKKQRISLPPSIPRQQLQTFTMQPYPAFHSDSQPLQQNGLETAWFSESAVPAVINQSGLNSQPVSVSECARFSEQPVRFPGQLEDTVHVHPASFYMQSTGFPGQSTTISSQSTGFPGQSTTISAQSIGFSGQSTGFLEQSRDCIGSATHVSAQSTSFSGQSSGFGHTQGYTAQPTIFCGQTTGFNEQPAGNTDADLDLELLEALGCVP